MKFMPMLKNYNMLKKFENFNTLIGYVKKFKNFNTRNS